MKDIPRLKLQLSVMFAEDFSFCVVDKTSVYSMNVEVYFASDLMTSNQPPSSSRINIELRNSYAFTLVNRNYVKTRNETWKLSRNNQMFDNIIILRTYLIIYNNQSFTNPSEEIRKCLSIFNIANDI